MTSVPIRGPLPRIPDHIGEPKIVWRKGTDGCRALEAIERQILPGEFSLPVVRHHLAIRRELFAPGKRPAITPTPACELPFSFRREFLACPGGVGGNIFPGNMHDRVFLTSLWSSLVLRVVSSSRPVAMPTTGSGRDRHPARRLRARPPIQPPDRRIGAGIFLQRGDTLSEGDIARLLHKAPEFHIGNLSDRSRNRPPSPGAGRFLGIAMVRTHRECSTRNPDHVEVARRRERVGGQLGSTADRVIRKSAPCPAPFSSRPPSQEKRGNGGMHDANQSYRQTCIHSNGSMVVTRSDRATSTCHRPRYTDYCDDRTPHHSSHHSGHAGATRQYAPSDRARSAKHSVSRSD